jgi:hypothetical protein
MSSHVGTANQLRALARQYAQEWIPDWPGDAQILACRCATSAHVRQKSSRFRTQIKRFSESNC